MTGETTQPEHERLLKFVEAKYVTDEPWEPYLRSERFFAFINRETGEFISLTNTERRIILSSLYTYDALHESRLRMKTLEKAMKTLEKYLAKKGLLSFVSRKSIGELI